MLKNKVIVITGSSRGIGAAAARQVAEWGGRVVVNYKQSEAQALNLVSELRGKGAEAIAVRADVTKRSEVEEMARRVRAEFGPVDVVVNNAMLPFAVGAIHETGWDDLKNSVEQEMVALHNCVQVFSPHMIDKKKGKFIVVSSALAQRPFPRLGAYVVGKAALEAMSNTLALELGPLGITVNVVAPAFTLTGLAADMMPESFKERTAQARPLRRHLMPEDIAGSVAFLASDRADMITGCRIVVNGGEHLSVPVKWQP